MTKDKPGNDNGDVELTSIKLAEADAQKAPTTVAGGWGGLNISPLNDNDQPSEEGKRRKIGFLQNFHDKFPRSYHSLFSVFLPVFIIIPIAILCGYFLAEMEAPNEKVANNAAMADLATNFVRVDKLAVGAYGKFDKCVDTFNNTSGDMVNMTEYRAHVTECKFVMEVMLNKTSEGLKGYITDVMEGTVTFDWITCKKNRTSSRVEPVQRDNFIRTWVDDFYGLWAAYAATGEYEGDGALEQAIKDASGSDICDINVASGAMFWWTVMTTVGYGNTAPTTEGGRSLVFTMGFITILIFTAIIGNAGYVMLVIVDDFFKRVNLKKLINGGFAILFWLCMLVLWMLAVAGIVIARKKDRYGSEEGYMSLGNAFWFTYITSTTVGLGDFYIHHDVVTIGDMFYLPLLFLASFVLLSNFLYKLSDVVGPLLSSGVSLGDVLDKKSASKDEAPKESPQDSITKRGEFLDENED